MIELALSLLGSLIGGGFGWLNRKTDTELEVKKLDLERDKLASAERMHAMTLEQTKLELSNAAQIAVIEEDAKVEQERFRTIAAVEQADQTSADELNAAGRLRWLFVLVSAWRKGIRPFITTFYAVISGVLVSALIWALLERWDALDSIQRYDLERFALGWLLTQTTATIQFWLVARGPVR